MRTTEENVQQEQKTRRRLLYPFVILTVIELILSAVVVMFIIIRINENNHKFCDLIDASLAGKQIHKPANPSQNKKEEQAYKGYILVHNLGQSLGCIK